MSEEGRVILRGKEGESAHHFSVSSFAIGCWRLADWHKSAHELADFIVACVERGLTTFDHADIYGDYRCEGLFGEALSLIPSLKQQCEIITKCNIKLVSANRPSHQIKSYDTSRQHILDSAHKSLKQLGVDRIDLLLLHRPDPLMDPEAVSHAFAELKQSGDVAHFGLSNHRPSQFDMLSGFVDEPLVTNQVELSALSTQVIFDGTLDHALEHGYRPMAWSPMAGGRLFNRGDNHAQAVSRLMAEIGRRHGAYDVSQVALSWVGQHPSKPVPVLGSGRIERIDSAIASQSLKLSREEWFEILQQARGQEVD